MPRTERPLDSADTELGRFAADLRALRDKAGKPSYRALASRAHYSAATLSGAAGGKKLPGLAVTLAYVTACGGDAQEQVARDLCLGGAALSDEKWAKYFPDVERVPVC